MLHRRNAIGARVRSFCDAITQLAWAPGRGVKGAVFKNYWDIELGISFIPWEKIKSQEELDSVVEGGWIDPATCPPGMKPSTQTRSESPQPFRCILQFSLFLPFVNIGGEAATAKQDINPPDSNSPLLPPSIPILPGTLPQPMFSTSGPPNMVAIHPGMGAPPFGMGPPPPIGGAHFHPMPVRPSFGGPPSHFFVESMAAPTPQESAAPPSETGFGFDATTDEDMQLDDAENESSAVQAHNSSGSPDVNKQEEFDVPEREDSKHDDSDGPQQQPAEDSKHYDSDDPQHASLDDHERVEDYDKLPPSSAAERGAEATLSEDSPVLSPDDFQMSNREDPDAYDDSGHGVGAGAGEDNEERPQQGSES